MPGDFVRWVEETETAESIESYGAMNVTLSTEDGERLQLDDGQRARLAIPLAAGRNAADAPATMPLFFWADEKGYWIEEGYAALQEVSPGHFAYVGTVAHFTTWNADVAYDSVSIEGVRQ